MFNEKYIDVVVTAFVAIFALRVLANDDNDEGKSGYKRNVLYIYFAIFTRKFMGVEVGSKSRTTEHKGKGRSNTPPRMSGEILLPAVTRPEIFPAMG